MPCSGYRILLPIYLDFLTVRYFLAQVFLEHKSNVTHSWWLTLTGLYPVCGSRSARSVRQQY